MNRDTSAAEQLVKDSQKSLRLTSAAESRKSKSGQREREVAFQAGDDPDAHNHIGIQSSPVRLMAWSISCRVILCVSPSL